MCSDSSDMSEMLRQRITEGKKEALRQNKKMVEHHTADVNDCV